MINIYRIRKVKKMAKWLTPEEMQRKKERKQKYLYILFIVFAAMIGGLVTVVMNSL